MSLYDIRRLADGFCNVRRNTIQVAEAIPEAKDQYRPTRAAASTIESP
jgi:hypothetical protein